MRIVEHTIRPPGSLDDVEVPRRTWQRFPRVVLTIGSFDGVHLGHQRIIERVVEEAARTEGTAAVMTLRPHPRQVFSPGHAPNLLTTVEQKLELFGGLGIDVVHFLQFDAEVAKTEPAEFVEQVICARCHAEAVIVGHDFTFGRNAQGNLEFLQGQAERFGFTVAQVPALFVEGERVSSTLIREQVLQGDLDRAESFLGRKYAVRATVVSGRGIGATLGFPTANIIPGDIAVPAQGVYAARAILDGRSYVAAVNIGIAPTIRHDDVMIEAHLLDFGEGQPQLAGRILELIFHKRLRPEKKFSSHQALAAQICRDIEQIRHCFEV